MPSLLLPLLGWAFAQTRPAESVPAGPTAALPDAAIEPTLPLSPPLSAALAARDWATAVPLLQAIDRTKLGRIKLPEPVADAESLGDAGVALLDGFDHGRRVRLVGFRVEMTGPESGGDERSSPRRRRRDATET